MWKPGSLTHQFAAKGKNGIFRNLPIADFDADLAKALKLSTYGEDVYFACAEYEIPENRKAENVVQARAFWMDIDCGEQKAADDKGYVDTAAAEAALVHFCESIGLYGPTHIVESGSGLHVYWALDKPVDAKCWQKHARQLKALTKSQGLIADPSRTADIASPLRLPGTLNHKQVPGRPVVLKQANPPIERDSMLQTISSAHEKLCGAMTEPAVTLACDELDREERNYGPADLTTLASALKVLDPDCDDATWKLKRLAPMAIAASQWPEQATELRTLARSWSSGALRDKPALAWTIPGAKSGITGEAAFDGTWTRFLTGQFGGRPATIGTIYHDAKEAGWRHLDAHFEVVETETIAGAVDQRQKPSDSMSTALAKAMNGDVGAPPRAAYLDKPVRLNTSSFPDQPTGTGRGLPTTIANTEHLLTSSGIKVRYNVISKKLEVSVPGQSTPLDNNVALARIQSLAALNGMTLPNLQGYLGAIGDEKQFNPTADWMLSKPWDGVDRLPAFYATLVEREGFPTALKTTLLYRWMLSVVAAALMPSGFRSRGVLTLQGPQSIGKTSWIRSLVSDPLLRESLIKLDHHLDPSNKDSLATAIEHSIVEIGELDSSFKKDIARLKGFLTAGPDKFRRPYDRFNSEYPRRTVFCASVNDDNFLVDPTGNTRFWTVPVTSLSHEHGIDMQQLYAQLAEDFNRGARWWLTPEEEHELESQNRNHVAVSALREMLLENLDLSGTGKSTRMTASQLLRALGIQVPNTSQVRECGAILREFLGSPTMVHKTSAWHVRIRETDINAPSVSAGQVAMPGTAQQSWLELCCAIPEEVAF